MPLKTEDQVRNAAGITLGFIDGQGNNVENLDFYFCLSKHDLKSCNMK